MVTASCFAQWSVHSVTTCPPRRPGITGTRLCECSLKDCSTRSEVSLRLSQPTPSVKTASIQKKKKKGIIVIGDVLLRGTKNPICTLDPLVKESLLSPKACVEDIRRTRYTLVQPSVLINY